ncbi:hypothetical protein [Actinocrispum wychmicini]|uniref:Uncharacterized protein n=1 Tax=Actinocrispum wychmicini TaxID=1213861 RepID=A0A4R2KEK3_9PSEU|nr:hypothetical protein [Actinocrispum wychmicini]TCO64965.1 hypothetical protein EV192_101749 [Actinocrispum wychmicini]
MPWAWMVRDDSPQAHASNVEEDWTPLPYVEAACKFTAPPRALDPYRGGCPFCVDCLIAVGDTMPVNLAWR